MTPLQHLAAIRAAYADAKARNDRHAMQYEAACEMWWFAHWNIDGTRRHRQQQECSQ
jgi:hypothetical protein